MHGEYVGDLQVSRQLQKLGNKYLVWPEWYLLDKNQGSQQDWIAVRVINGCTTCPKIAGSIMPQSKSAFYFSGWTQRVAYLRQIPFRFPWRNVQ